MSEVIVRMEMPKDCLWLEDGEIHKCPLLEYNDCCMVQSDEANEAAESWSDLRKGCPIVGVLPEQHGDLIDRDETFHAAQPEDCTDELWAKTTCGRVVLEAKTVIPATERSET